MHFNRFSMRTLIAGALLFGSVLLPLHAEMYKHVDEKGRVTYSNEPIKGGKKVDLPPISTVPAPQIAPKPETPPTPSPETPEARRQALMDAIAKEEKALETAKQAAKAGAENPEVFKRTRTITGTDGKPKQITETGRNVVAYEEKMKKLNDQVATHEANLVRLKTELAALEAAKDVKKR